MAVMEKVLDFFVSAILFFALVLIYTKPFALA